MANKQHKEEARKLKELDLSQKKFLANGKTYHIRKSMSFKRFREYEKLQIEVGYGSNFIQIYENVKQAYELVNKSAFADTAVKLYNILSGIKNIESRQMPALKICALFINAEDEDENTINDEMIDEKIADWEAEGYDIFPFFQLAVNSIPDFSIAYKVVSQLHSQMEVKGKPQSAKKR